jgi:hypothetical protein
MAESPTPAQPIVRDVVLDRPAGLRAGQEPTMEFPDQ